MHHYFGYKTSAENCKTFSTLWRRSVSREKHQLFVIFVKSEQILIRTIVNTWKSYCFTFTDHTVMWSDATVGQFWSFWFGISLFAVTSRDRPGTNIHVSHLREDCGLKCMHTSPKSIFKHRNEQTKFWALQSFWQISHIGTRKLNLCQQGAASHVHFLEKQEKLFLVQGK